MLGVGAAVSTFIRNGPLEIYSPVTQVSVAVFFRKGYLSIAEQRALDVPSWPGCITVCPDEKSSNHAEWNFCDSSAVKSQGSCPGRDLSTSRHCQIDADVAGRTAAPNTEVIGVLLQELPHLLISFTPAVFTSLEHTTEDGYNTDRTFFTMETLYTQTKCLDA